MRYFIQQFNEYILGVGEGSGGVEITESEYNEILSVIHNKPQATATTDYRLKTDLTWESYEKEPEPEPEPDDSDYATAGRILMGVEA